ncbi:hypothetical protein JB92DRAFT_2837080 [Gautieria morchelliformis]|nr:hypothetical protein JB92DRAFT_2837080 [Gautieria morchelliformis]
MSSFKPRNSLPNGIAAHGKLCINIIIITVKLWLPKLLPLFKPEQPKGIMDRTKDKVKVMVPAVKLGDPLSGNANENSKLLLDSTKDTATFPHESQCFLWSSDDMFVPLQDERN